AAASAIGASARGTASQRASALSRTLVIADATVADNIDPEAPNRAVVANIDAVENLYDAPLTFGTRRNPASQGGGFFPVVTNFKPWLAASVKHNAVGDTWLITLRKGVKSEAGNELTTADVVWSWNRSLALKRSGRNSLILRMKLKRVKALDKYRLR